MQIVLSTRKYVVCIYTEQRVVCYRVSNILRITENRYFRIKHPYALYEHYYKIDLVIQPI